MDTRDDITKQHFNQLVEFEANEEIVLGDQRVDAAFAARLTGAPDNSRVVLDVDDKGASRRVSLRVYNSAMFTQAANYEIEQTDTGYMILSNLSIVLSEKYQKHGFGLRMFAHQAYAAQAANMNDIVLYGARGGPLEYNGYYSWPRYGFDAELSPSDEEQLSPPLVGLRTVRELMSTAVGRAHWKAVGTGRHMQFTLTDQDAWHILESYMKEKGVKI